MIIALHENGDLVPHEDVASYDADWKRVRLVSKSARTHREHQKFLRECWDEGLRSLRD